MQYTIVANSSPHELQIIYMIITPDILYDSVFSTTGITGEKQSSDLGCVQLVVHFDLALDNLRILVDIRIHQMIGSQCKDDIKVIRQHTFQNISVSVTLTPKYAVIKNISDMHI